MRITTTATTFLGLAASLASLTDAQCNKVWDADNFCDPRNNNAACNYDGGDCCGNNVKKRYCSSPNGPDSVLCSCLEPNPPTEEPTPDLANAIRKEVREMTELEWTTYAGAIKLVQASGFWQTMADIHSVNFQRGIHHSPAFFPWHRAYLRMMEEELTKVAGTTVTIPYWDWTFDCADMNGSPIFGANRFGGFPTDKTDNSECVTTGIFQTLDSPTGSRCLRRSERTRLNGRGYDRAAVVQAFKNDDGQEQRGGGTAYEEVRSNVEGSMHISVHRFVGGDMRSPAAPLDPIFWSHHAMIDNVWSQWQDRHPDNVDAYQGSTTAALLGLDGWTVQDTFNLRPFKPIEEQRSGMAVVAARFASRGAGNSTDSVTLSTASESVETLNLLDTLSAEQLLRIPRTCPAPNRNDDNELFWDAEIEERVIAEMESRFQLAQSLGLAETDDCLASPELIQFLVAEKAEPTGNKVISAGLGAVEGAGIAVGSIGLVGIGAAFVVSKRRQQQQGVSDDVPQPFVMGKPIEL